MSGASEGRPPSSFSALGRKSVEKHNLLGKRNQAVSVEFLLSCHLKPSVWGFAGCESPHAHTPKGIADAAVPPKQSRVARSVVGVTLGSATL